MSDAGSTGNQNANGDKPAAPRGLDAGEDPLFTAKQDTPKTKVGVSSERHLDVPLQNSFIRTSNTFSDISSLSAENERTGRLLVPSHGLRLSSISPAPPQTWKAKAAQVWTRNKGLALVVLAQVFGVMMNVTTRLLETEGGPEGGMHPFQILFVRMVATVILSSAYQWITKVKDAPFGPPEVRKLLVLRGTGGFFGAFGLYYSLIYLPLADATVITFLAPIVACWACSILIHEPFTRPEQIAGIVSFVGVVLIARPASLIPSKSDHPTTAGSGTADGLPKTNNGTNIMPVDASSPMQVTSAQRLGAVGMAIIGVFGAACAYTTIRWIGKRAHPLISVNYYAAWTTLVSTIALLTIPGVDFKLPANLRQWFYIIFLGITGFVMQFMLTAGLSYERSSRATNMVYTQMLWALAFDKVVFNTSPGILSILGSSLILGSALYVAVLNNKAKEGKKTSRQQRQPRRQRRQLQQGPRSSRETGSQDEELGLMSEEDHRHGRALGAEDDDDDDDLVGEDDIEVNSPADVQEVQLRTIRV